jgi:hypothetical protein
MILDMRPCEGGGLQFRPNYRRAKYCSTACSKKQSRDRWTPIEPPFPARLSTGTIGALSEIVVCADLLSHGYEVFRAVSPSSSCDMIVLKNGATLRIEVRTGHKLANGLISFGTYPRDRGRSDILAIAINGVGIFYKRADTLEDTVLL